MIAMDLARAVALAVLAFMIGDLVGDLLNETRELWGIALGMFALITGTAIAMHRDEMRAYHLEF